MAGAIEAEGPASADVTLGEYVANGTAILIVVDRNYAIDVKRRGFWVYRDWQSETPRDGHLNVYDRYSRTVSFERMKNDQLRKFAEFDGRMQHDRDVPCDLFLLSWTLTPDTAVWFAAIAANRRLAHHMRNLAMPNARDQIVNLLYVDYVEFARVTDVAIAHNPLVRTRPARTLPVTRPIRRL